MSDPVAYWMWVGLLAILIPGYWLIFVAKWWPIPWAAVAVIVALAACSRCHS